MTQQLLDFDQAANLRRVSGRIAGIVADFCRAHEGQVWHISDLVAYVQARTQVAPASPDRILRLLRRQGVINYVVTNRAASEYRSLPVEARQ